ncbi:MAG: mechanosensitive ion channel [Sulfuritalea sp.]|nr:mechanosensitive ion channel [Sulfuritalea sp.]
MKESELTGVWRFVLADLSKPDLVWQLLALGACLLLAGLVERVLRRRRVHSGGAWKDGLQRLAFPVIALILVALVRVPAQHVMNVGLFALALPLLSSLAVIRAVLYVLRLSFVGATWLQRFERNFALLIWSIVALHITGLLPDVILVLDSISFHAGQQNLTLWNVLQGIAAVLFTVLAALWMGNLLERRLNEEAGLDGNVRVVLARLAKALLLLLAVLIGLPMVGIDLTTLSVFGGALGVGLGFGLQKIASNYVSGFIILLDNSIRIGNMITVGGDRGEVIRITTRYTVVKNRTGIEALVPNEMLVSSVVLNETHSDPQVRVALPVQISYGSDLERAMAVMREAAQAQSRVLVEPAPVVLLKEFADSGINLEMRFWVADPENGLGRLRSAINLAIWDGFKQSGIVIPFPQREIRILKDAEND